MRNVLLILAVIILTCCKTTERVEYVPVETVKTEYRDRIVETYDSVHITDSVYVAVKGDTTLVYKYRDRWKLKLVHDTAYVNRTDSIRTPYPVEKKLSKWEKHAHPLHILRAKSRVLHGFSNINMEDIILWGRRFPTKFIWKRARCQKTGTM